MSSFGEERASGSGANSEGDDLTKNDKRLEEDFYSMLNVPKDV